MLKISVETPSGHAPPAKRTPAPRAGTGTTLHEILTAEFRSDKAGPSHSPPPRFARRPRQCGRVPLSAPGSHFAPVLRNNNIPPDFVF